MTQKQITITVQGKKAKFMGYTRARVKNFIKFPLIQFWAKRGIELDIEKKVCKVKFEGNKKIYYYPVEVVDLYEQKEICDPKFHKSWGGILIKNEVT